MAKQWLYNRVLLKLSGEALKGGREFGYEPEALRSVAERLAALISDGLELAIVVGAGNLWRGRMGSARMDRVTADHMGMLATAMNALALKEAFRAVGVNALVQCAVPLEPFVPRYDRDRTLTALGSGSPVIFAGGTGNPYFTTDTASALRALETDCDALLKATKVDGVYSADPFKHPEARRFSRLSFDEALERHLEVMDAAAFSLCRDNGLPIVVFNFSAPGALERILTGDTSAGTIVGTEGE